MRSAARRFVLLAAASMAAALGAAPAPGAAPAGEYQVKAAYLFNFSQFVEWPPAAYESATSPFVIGIVGEDPFGGAIDAVVRGESLAGRPLVVRRFANAGELSGCNIVFVARDQAALLDDTLRALRGRHVLTVTDAPGAESRDAMIVLFNDNNRIRMRINLAAARASQLVISSKLLRPAEVVGAGGER